MSSNRNILPAHWRGLFFGVIVIVAVGLRFAHLDRRLYWNDEVLASLRAAGFTVDQVFATYYDGSPFPAHELRVYQSPSDDKSWEDSLRSMATEPQQSPLFFLMMRAWMLVGGYTPGAMRALAATISLMSLPAFYWLASSLFRQRLVAWLAVVLLCVSPMFVLLAREARPYSLLIVIAMASSAAFFDALSRNRTANWVLYAITIVIGVHTHLYFGFVMLAQGVYVLLGFVRAVGISRPNGRMMKSYIVANLVGLMSFLPWALFSLPYLSSKFPLVAWASTPKTITFLVRKWGVQYSGAFIDLEPLTVVAQLAFVGAILLIEVYAFIFMLRKGPREASLFIVLQAIIPVLILATPDLVLGGWRSAVPRYQVPVFISLQLAVAYLLGQKLSQDSGRWRVGWRVITVALLFAGLVSSIWAVRATEWWNKGSDYLYPQTVAAINGAEHPLVIVGGFRSDLFGATMAIANEMKPQVDMLWTTDIEPQVLEDYDTIFLFRPSEELLQTIERDTGRQAKLMVPAKLWQLSGVAD